MDPIAIFAYEGPNIYSPQPGVRLLALAPADRSGALRAALKESALFIGLPLAFLEVEARPRPAGVLHSASFSTDDPPLGAEMAAYVLAGLGAAAAAPAQEDEAPWDRDGPLLALQARRRHSAPPAAALRLLAEAQRRGLPTTRLADGRALIGYGAASWAFDTAALRDREARPPAPPWERLGSIPIVAVTGGPGRVAAVGRWEAELRGAGLSPQAVDGATFDQLRARLADPELTALVAGLDTVSILRHGLPFDRCATAVISDAGSPPHGIDPDEWLRALGLPMLVSAQPAQINLADPALRPLIPYAPNGVIGAGDER